MLQLNTTVLQTDCVIHIDSRNLLSGRDYDMTIVNLATQEEAVGYTTWTANVVNNRYVTASFNTRFLPTGMYIVTFFASQPAQGSWVHLAYASPGGDTAIPQTTHDPDDTSEIHIYYGE